MANAPPPPELIAALNEGVAHHRGGMLDAAEMAYRRALAIAPDDHNALRLLTGLAIHREKWDVALDFARRAVARQPRHGEMHRLLAVALMETGDAAGAIATAQKAIELGDGPFAQLVLANAHLRGGDSDSAKKLYRDILRRDPDNAAANANLGKLLLHEHGDSEAEKHLAKAIAAEPNNVEALKILGLHYADSGRPRKAAKMLGRAATLQPNDWQLQRALGATLSQLKNYSAAVLAYRSALNRSPNDREANLGLAGALVALKQPVAALRVIEKVLLASPDDGVAHWAASLAYDQIYDRDRSIGHLRRAVESAEPVPQAVAAWAFYTLHDGSFGPDESLAAHRRWAAANADPITAVAKPPPPVGRADKKLRIGYVSGDFFAHSMAYYLEAMLRHHDRNGFAVYAYSAGLESDATTERLRKLADQWRDISLLDDDEAVATIQRDHIDILIDPSGYTADNRLKVFAARPAPIQATWLGYPATTGMQAMGWRITDTIADPPGQSEAHFTEQLLHLKRGPLAFAAPEPALPIGPLPAAGNGFITFCAFNNAAKISPPAFDAWSRILQKLPSAILQLKDTRFAHASAREAMLGQFTARQIGPERIVFIPRATRAEHLASIGATDIALDTFPYNGGTTTCETLWMGVPVVCLMGDRYVSRLGASILSHAGLSDWIARSVDEYVAIAVKHAQDLQALAQLRGQLRGKFLAGLGDGPAYVREMEAALRRVWAEAVARRDGAQRSATAS